MSTQTANPDLLPTEATMADFRRLAALVTTVRYRIEPECRWNHEDVAEQLWENQDGLPFCGVALAAMRAARDTSIKTPADIGRHIAGVAA